jgi:sarcosine oxidase, subunit gamma
MTRREFASMRESAVRETALITESVLVRASLPCSRHSLRGSIAAIQAAVATLGLRILKSPCRAAQLGSYAALWLGPDERLVLGPHGRAEETASLLEQGLRAHPHSLVDVGHRQIGLEVCGPHAATVLNAGCPLDLAIDAFPIGMCTCTVFAKSEIVLWRTAEEVFRVEVWRSFASYVSGLLAEAARGIS